MTKNLFKSISIAGAVLTSLSVAAPMLTNNTVSAADLSDQQQQYNNDQLAKVPNKKDFYRKIYIKLPGQDPQLYQESHITFTRDLTQDIVTGKVTPGAWSKDEDLDEVKAPTYPGYSVDKDSIPKETVTPDTEDQSYTFTYSPVQQSVKINYVNDQGNTISSQTISGKTGDTVNVPFNSLNIPSGYRIKGGTTYPSAITFGVNKLDDYTIHVEPNTQEAGQEQKSVTRTIIIKTPGRPDQKATQVATFTRSKIYDPTTNQTTYTPWSSDTELPEFDVPQVDGLTPDRKSIPAVKVSGDSNDITETINYTANEQSVNINYMHGKDKVGTQTITGVTGQSVNVVPNVPAQYQIKGGESVPTVITFGSKPLSDINIQVDSDSDLDKAHAQQDNEKNHLELQNMILYENDKIPDAKSVVLNLASLPKGTDVKWTNAPDSSSVGKQEATLLVTYPDQTSTSAKIPVEIVKRQAGMHISNSIDPAPTTPTNNKNTQATDSKSDDSKNSGSTTVDPSDPINPINNNNQNGQDNQNSDSNSGVININNPVNPNNDNIGNNNSDPVNTNNSNYSSDSNSGNTNSGNSSSDNNSENNSQVNNEPENNPDKNANTDNNTGNNNDGLNSNGNVSNKGYTPSDSQSGNNEKTNEGKEMDTNPAPKNEVPSINVDNKQNSDNKSGNAGLLDIGTSATKSNTNKDTTNPFQDIINLFKDLGGQRTGDVSAQDLQKVINSANSLLNETDNGLSDSTKKEIQSAVKDAQDAINSKDQSKMNSAYDKLYDLMDKNGDSDDDWDRASKSERSDLQYDINKAKTAISSGILNGKKLTTQEINNLKTAVSNAEAVLNNPNATSSQVNDADMDLYDELMNPSQPVALSAEAKKAQQDAKNGQDQNGTNTNGQNQNGNSAQGKTDDNKSYPTQKDNASYPDKASYGSRLPQTGENVQSATLGLAGIAMLGLTALGANELRKKKA